MTRVRIAAGILSLLIILSISSIFLVRRQCRQVLTVLEQLSLAADTGDKEQMHMLCTAAQDRWEEVQGALMCLVSHEKLTSADQAFCRLIPLLEADCDEFEAELATVQTMLMHITQGETPYLTNVF
ncbi:MAG: DUF4363 family protein [Ruminococcus sp.]|nr:DUF4363 family protein [Ruminococcus sp.]